MSLTTPMSVQKLQTALHDKAKESPDRRFHALYDKVYRRDVLTFAYQCCKANGGAEGVDGQSFEHIEEYGEERWLDELVQQLKSRMYRPSPVRRVYIPKPDGKQRPLGVPRSGIGRCKRRQFWYSNRSMREKPPVRFDERGVETEQDAASEARADERAGERIGLI